MLHSKCKDKTRRSVELARARTCYVHPVISVPAGMKKILTDALGTQFITISSVRPQRHESKLFSSFQVRVRGLELDVGWLGFCPRASNWSRSVECARPAMSSSQETVARQQNMNLSNSRYTTDSGQNALQQVKNDVHPERSPYPILRLDQAPGGY